MNHSMELIQLAYVAAVVLTVGGGAFWLLSRAH